MTYFIFLENGQLNGCGECEQLTAGVENISVSEKQFNEFVSEPEKFIYKDGNIVENPDYGEILKQKENEEKRREFRSQLDDLDKKRIRAICENEVKDSETGETWLDYYNSEIVKIRSLLNSIC